MNTIAVAAKVAINGLCILGNIFSPLGSCSFVHDEEPFDYRRCLEHHYNTYYVRSLDNKGREVMVKEQYLVCDFYSEKKSVAYVLR